MPSNVFIVKRSKPVVWEDACVIDDLRRGTPPSTARNPVLGQPLVRYGRPSATNPTVTISWGSASRVLPLRPVPDGFALNTLFYAAILWVVTGGLAALRRFWRVEQGFCPRCAYPTGRSSVCTECGVRLPRWRPAPTT